MPYTKTIWKNREVERPRTYQITDNLDGTKTLTPKEGQILEQGTAINADVMNKIETGLEQAHSTLDGLDTNYIRKQEINTYLDTKLDVNGTAVRAGELATSRLIDGMSFDGTINIIHYSICTTTAATSLKYVSLRDFFLVSGSRISIKFQYNNTASNPTLNVNGTGYKNILKADGKPFKDWAAGGVYTFIYDGTSFILQGEGGGKKWDSGTITANNSFRSFNNHLGNPINYNYVSFDMSRLDFTPSIIEFRRTDKLTVELGSIWYKDNHMQNGGQYANVSVYNSGFRVPYFNGIVYIPVYWNGISYDWTAYE